MSITQTVEIPPSHRLTIDVPREVPAGPVILTFTPEAKPKESMPEPAEGEKPSTSHADFLSGLLDPNIPTPITDRLSGILAGAGDITREQIREERLSKYLQ